jgi:quercetin dioxygenase-like cupin family protein
VHDLDRADEPVRRPRTNPIAEPGRAWQRVLPEPAPTPNCSCRSRIRRGDHGYDSLFFGKKTRVQNTPDWSGSFGASYEIPLGRRRDADARADVLYSGEYLLSASAPNVMQEAYAKIDARLTFRTADELSVQAFRAEPDQQGDAGPDHHRHAFGPGHLLRSAHLRRAARLATRISGPASMPSSTHEIQGRKQRRISRSLVPGVSENPDQFVHIPEPHGFNIGGARQPPNCVNSQHNHQTAEVFVVHSGEWTFNLGEHGDDVRLPAGPGSVVSIPTGMFRGFSNVGDGEGFLWVVLGGDDPGRVQWAPYVFDMAARFGLTLLEDGTLVDTAKGRSPCRKAREP